MPAAATLDTKLDQSFLDALTKFKTAHLLQVLARLNEPPPVPLKPISEVTPMSLSATAIKLAHKYMGLVEKYENHFDSSGYTAHEFELVRTKAHNALIEQLRAEGIDTSDRAATTELARLAEQWLRD